jgi:hypothetical protein
MTEKIHLMKENFLEPKKYIWWKKIIFIFQKTEKR